MDLGERCAYQVLGHGTPVYSSDGQNVGTVTHVLDVPSEDVFDGVIIAVPGAEGHRFVDADDVADIHERGLVLKLDATACLDLPQPSANPAAMRANIDSIASSGRDDRHAKLRRAWDLISGRR
jgi:PRC-barrel domain